MTGDLGGTLYREGDLGRLRTSAEFIQLMMKSTANEGELVLN